MTTLIQFANNAAGTLAGSITNVATGISLTAGHGARFPTLTGSQYFYATLRDASNNLEVIKVTARSTDTLTATRGQEGTTALSFPSGVAIELRPTAASLAALHDEAVVDANTATLTHAATGKTTPADADEMPWIDSAAAWVLKKMTWANLKAALFSNPTITNYVETAYVPAAGSNFTVSLANGTMQKFTTDANTTITLPTPAAGKSYTILISYGGAHTLTWSGGGTLKWPGGAAPTPTSASGKIDVFCFSSVDGTNTLGASGGANY